jgi:hypothetical protein
VTRGLGNVAAREFAEVSDEEGPSVQVNGLDDLAEGIRAMATGLRKRQR